jgi:hypothetical protein
MAEREYRRLTRSRQRAGFAVSSLSRTSLWLGKDHLLCIDTTGYTETYKRFYFRDIQAIILRRTNSWRIFSLGCALAAGLLTLWAALTNDSVAWIVLGIPAGLFLLLLTSNLIAGPSCRCHLRTAVQTEELPSLSRVGRARRALDRLRPLIVEAQGGGVAAEVVQGGESNQ